MTQKKVSGMSNHGPPRNYCGALKKNYKSCVEKETGSYIRCLRTDRGGEFTSHEFTNFCKENGIHRRLTATYTPQYNGVVKRKNQTIMNMVRNMLLGRKIPKSIGLSMF